MDILRLRFSMFADTARVTNFRIIIMSYHCHDILLSYHYRWFPVYVLSFFTSGLPERMHSGERESRDEMIARRECDLYNGMCKCACFVHGLLLCLFVVLSVALS